MSKDNKTSDKRVVRRSFSLKKLIKSREKYEFEIDAIYKKIKMYVEFDFFVMYQPSDGFVIVHVDDAHNAPLSRCIGIIEDKAKLTFKDYIKECI